MKAKKDKKQVTWVRLDQNILEIVDRIAKGRKSNRSCEINQLVRHAIIRSIKRGWDRSVLEELGKRHPTGAAVEQVKQICEELDSTGDSWRFLEKGLEVEEYGRF